MRTTMVIMAAVFVVPFVASGCALLSCALDLSVCAYRTVASAEEPPTPPRRDKAPLAEEEVMAPLRSAAGLNECLSAEAAANDSVPSTVTLSFTIGMNGAATKVSIEEEDLKERPIASCVNAVVATLRWPESSEPKAVRVPLKVNRAQRSQ